MLALATLSLLAASHVAHGSPLLPPKLEHPTNMAPSRPASCSRICPLINGRGNVLKLLHADYRIIDGVKATVCEYTEDMRCLYDEDYGYMIVRADANVFECPERDELECEEQNDLNGLVSLHRRAPPQGSKQHQSQKKGKGKSNKKNTGGQHRGTNKKMGGKHNQQHRGGHDTNHAAQEQSRPSSSTPVDELAHHVSHALNGTHSANAKRIVLDDLTETRNTGNAVVHNAASLEHESVSQVYDVTGSVPQPGLPYVKRDASGDEAKDKRMLFVRPGSVEGANTNLV